MIASLSDCPVGRLPSVSTVNEMATGRPAARAARTMPIASLDWVRVYAVNMSISVFASQPICLEWYASASSAAISSSGA